MKSVAVVVQGPVKKTKDEALYHHPLLRYLSIKI